MSPVKPPIVKTKIKPTANSMGVSKLSAPRHIVAIQLKTLTPVGTEISIVAYIKNNSLDTGMPVANIWCAQTINDRIAIAATAYTIELEPKSGLRENAGITCEMIPNAGRIMIYTSGCPKNQKRSEERRVGKECRSRWS